MVWLFSLLLCLCHSSAKYLELRFNRTTRLLGTLFFIAQTVSKKPVNTIMAGVKRLWLKPQIWHMSPIDAGIISFSVTDPLHWNRHLCPGTGFKPRYVGFSPQRSGSWHIRTLKAAWCCAVEWLLSLTIHLFAVTGMNLWGAVISTGVVCTFYCTMVCRKCSAEFSSTHIKY